MHSTILYVYAGSPNFLIFQPCSPATAFGHRFQQALVLHVPLHHCPEAV
jgi:hypothetical protein